MNLKRVGSIQVELKLISMGFSWWQKGDKIVNEPLAKTFEGIRDNKEYFHTELAQKIVHEVNGFGGNFTLEDVTGYQIEETDLLPFEVRLPDFDKNFKFLVW